MQKEMEEVIKKNLPAQVGEVLSKELERLYKVETEYNYYRDIISKNEVEIKELKGEISKHISLDDKLKSIQAAQDKLDVDNRDLKIKTLEYQLEGEKDKTNFTKEVALGLVRNTEFKRTLFDNVNEPYKDQHGSTFYHNKTQSSTETKIAE